MMLVISDLSGAFGESVYVVYIILSVQDGVRFVLNREMSLIWGGDLDMPRKKLDVPVLVDFTKQVFVRAFERPERAFS